MSACLMPRVTPMGDLKNAKLIYLKGFLFLLIGLSASALLLIEASSLKVGLLLGLAVWGFARAYYFAFYVIQHYVDDCYKFAGLWSFLQYLCRRKSASERRDVSDHTDPNHES